MNASLLTISKPLTPERHKILTSLVQATSKMQLDFMLVGAFVRDVWLHQMHGLPIERTTMDTDFAVRVENWAEYQQLRTELTEHHGFTGDTNRRHPEKLYSPDTAQLDLLPFGGVTDSLSGTIRWPVDGSEMSMLGFDEAYAASVAVRFERPSPPVQVRMLNPVGLALLKLVAWQDRQSDPIARRKHVVDLISLIQYYIHPLNKHRLLAGDDSDIADTEDDALFAGARLLGRDLARLASQPVITRISALISKNASRSGRCELARDMRNLLGGSFDTATHLLLAMQRGLQAP